YHYTPFGEIENSTNALQPLRFMGRELDADTSLYYVRNRWYDPVLGRFVSEDPIGLRGGINPYAYVGNDPVNLRDPQGLSPTCSTFISVTGDEWEAIGAQSREALESLGICLSVTFDTLVVNGGMPNGVAPIPPAPPDNAWLCPSCAGKIPTSHQGPTIGPGMPMTWVKQRIANAAAECRQWRRWAAAWTLLHIAGDVRQVMTTPAPTVTPGDSRIDLSGYGSDLASNYGESATAMANERCKALGVP
ncbi:MAG: RHS repeat-associated core domain-containing protein, partial [Thermoanaerobaculia bacterium]